jgi:LPXTG-motif cell wall-anchored protein
VKVKADGTPVSGHFTRGNGWLIRLTETGFPSDAGVLWQPGTFVRSDGVTVDEQGRAIVAITPKSNVSVQLKNTATLGELTVTKKVDEGTTVVDPNLEFKVTAHVTEKEGEGPRDIPFTLKANQSYTLKDLPIGAVVTFDETQPVDTDFITWGTPKFEPSSVTVSEGTSGSEVILTNTASETTGTFTIAKKVVGPEAGNSNVPETFDVKATWTDADGNEQSTTLTVPTNGNAVDFGEQLPGGTEVTVTEDVPTNGNGLAWATPTFSGEGVTTDEDGNAVVTIGKDVKAVTVTNTVAKNDGTLRLTKTVSGEAADLVGKDPEFTVTATWKDGDEYKSTELKVSKGQVTELGVDLPVGTEVTFEETDKPNVPGVEWGSVTWGVADDQTCQVQALTAGVETSTWLRANTDGTATGIVSDETDCGRLISLTNEAKHSLGKVEFEKKIVTDDGDTISVDEAVEKGLLPEDVSFDVTIKDVNVSAGQTAPEGAVQAGDTITLDKANEWKWTSGDLPKGTVVTFDEVTPVPLPGVDWAKPQFDEGQLTVEGGKTVPTEIRNTIVPTTEVDIEKTVTGPLANKLAKKTTFEVTASWTDKDGFDKTCVFTVKNGESAVPTENCDATVIDGKVYFPQGTEITFEETGASEDARHLTWKDVKWTVEEGNADLDSEDKGDRFPTIATVTIKGESPVTIGLENESGIDGLIIIPIIPIIPPHPPVPGTPTEPGTPVTPETPTTPVEGTPGHPGQAMPEQPSSSSSDGGLANTGASVIGLTALALILVGGGAWLLLRNRREGEA